MFQNLQQGFDDMIIHGRFGIYFQGNSLEYFSYFLRYVMQYLEKAYSSSMYYRSCN